MEVASSLGVCGRMVVNVVRDSLLKTRGGSEGGRAVETMVVVRAGGVTVTTGRDELLDNTTEVDEEEGVDNDVVDNVEDVDVVVSLTAGAKTGGGSAAATVVVAGGGGEDGGGGGDIDVDVDVDVIVARTGVLDDRTAGGNTVVVGDGESSASDSEAAITFGDGISSSSSESPSSSSLLTSRRRSSLIPSRMSSRPRLLDLSSSLAMIIRFWILNWY